jgi:hypothetical protein
MLMLWASIFVGETASEITIKVTILHFNGPSHLLAHGYNLTDFLIVILWIRILLIMQNLNTNYSNNYPQERWK